MAAVATGKIKVESIPILIRWPEMTPPDDLVYRPERFDEVYGQDRVVERLRHLIWRNKLERNLLFIGDRGSGKTTLARLYARALNCEQNEPDGSPCGRCASCIDPSRSDPFEYDTPGEGGAKEQVTGFVHAAILSVRECRVRVIFFDEAHALDDDAADALLKRVEAKPPGVVFCFATTFPGELREALISRLMVFEVRALTTRLAIEFLQKAAARRNYDYDPDALAVLAAAKRNYPRDLLIGLDQVGVEGERITVEDVKATFGVDQTDILARYFTALADGEGATQTEILENWNESWQRKAEWIQNFVLSIYYNNLLGRSVIVDPLIHADLRRHNLIVQKFRARLKPVDDAALVDFWLGLVRFWVVHRAINESGAQLAVALFANVVNTATVYRTKSAAPLVVTSDFDPQKIFEDVASGDDAADDVPSSQAEWIGPQDVRKVVDRASIYFQQTGLPFNASIRVCLAVPDALPDAQAATALREFVAALAKGYTSSDMDVSSSFAAIAVLELGDDGCFAMLAAFVPNLDRPDGAQKLKAFLKIVRSDTYPAVAFATSAKVAPRHAAAALAFHWDIVLALCAGAYEPEIEDKAGRKGLLDKLNVSRSKRRSPRPVAPPRVMYCGAVSDAAVRQAEALGVTFLSPIEDEAFGVIRKGWEAEEHEHRRSEIRERQEALSTLRTTYTDPQQRREEEQRRLVEWGRDPHLRLRRWKKHKLWF